MVFGDLLDLLLGRLQRSAIDDDLCEGGHIFSRLISIDKDRQRSNFLKFDVFERDGRSLRLKISCTQLEIYGLDLSGGKLNCGRE